MYVEPLVVPTITLVWVTMTVVLVTVEIICVLPPNVDLLVRDVITLPIVVAEPVLITFAMTLMPSIRDIPKTLNFLRSYMMSLLHRRHWDGALLVHRKWCKSLTLSTLLPALVLIAGYRRRYSTKLNLLVGEIISRVHV